MTDEHLLSFEDFVSRSIAARGVAKYLDAAGIRIHYLEWQGPPGAPVLLMLHGFLGHAHWWDFIAPWLAANYRVIAPDFGGMGDSGHRQHYVHTTFVEEIVAIITQLKLAPCTVIAHSFGGRCALFACRAFPELIGHAVIVDSRLGSQDDPMQPFDDRWRPKKRYQRLEDILPRFRLRPDEPCPALTRQHVARMSVKQDGDAWVWKFDEQVTRLFHDHPEAFQLELEELRDLPMPVDVIAGEKSVVCTPRRAHRMVELIANARGPVIIPTAYHHIPIGQPIGMLAALQGVLCVHQRARYEG